MSSEKSGKKANAKKNVPSGRKYICLSFKNWQYFLEKMYVFPFGSAERGIFNNDILCRCPGFIPVLDGRSSVIEKETESAVYLRFRERFFEKKNPMGEFLPSDVEGVGGYFGSIPISAFDKGFFVDSSSSSQGLAPNGNLMIPDFGSVFYDQVSKMGTQENGLAWKIPNFGLFPVDSRKIQEERILRDRYNGGIRMLECIEPGCYDSFICSPESEKFRFMDCFEEQKRHPYDYELVFISSIVKDLIRSGKWMIESDEVLKNALDLLTSTIEFAKQEGRISEEELKTLREAWGQMKEVLDGTIRAGSLLKSGKLDAFPGFKMTLSLFMYGNFEGFKSYKLECIDRETNIGTKVLLARAYGELVGLSLLPTELPTDNSVKLKPQKVQDPYFRDMLEDSVDAECVRNPSFPEAPVEGVRELKVRVGRYYKADSEVIIGDERIFYLAPSSIDGYVDQQGEISRLKMDNAEQAKHIEKLNADKESLEVKLTDHDSKLRECKHELESLQTQSRRQNKEFESKSTELANEIGRLNAENKSMREELEQNRKIKDRYTELKKKMIGLHEMMKLECTEIDRLLNLEKVSLDGLESSGFDRD